MLDPIVVSAQVAQLKAQLDAMQTVVNGLDTDLGTVATAVSGLETNLDATVSSRASASALTTLSDTVSQRAAPFKQPMLVQYLTSSKTYIVPATGLYRIYVFGGGGSGAKSGVAGNYAYTGGGAGGMAIKDAYLSSGTELTVTVGAAGTIPSVAGNGSAGGASSVVGAGLNIVANGGNGGGYGTTSVTGATGGTASGGDVNTTGGSSGSTTGTATSSLVAYAGGGAVNVLGQSFLAAPSQAPTATTGQQGHGGGIGNGRYSHPVLSATLEGGIANTTGYNWHNLWFFPFPFSGGIGIAGAGGGEGATGYEGSIGTGNKPGALAGGGSGNGASGTGGFPGGGAGTNATAHTGAGCVVIVFMGA